MTDTEITNDRTYITPCCRKVQVLERDTAVLVCPICKQMVGLFNASEISIPLSADDFRPLCEKHCYPRTPSPFLVHAQHTWRDVRCRMYGCNNLIFTDSSSTDHVTTLLTTEGEIEIGVWVTPKKPEEEAGKHLDNVMSLWGQGPSVTRLIIDASDIRDVDPNAIRDNRIVALATRGDTYKTIAKKFGISKGRIAQIVHKAKQKEAENQNNADKQT